MTIRGRMLTLLAIFLCVVSLPAGAVEYTFRRAVGARGGPGAVDGNGPLARFNQPTGIVADASGTLYVVDRGNAVIRTIDLSGAVRTFAGIANSGCSSIDGVRNDARFCQPWDVALDSAGNVFVAEASSARIRRITPGGSVTTFAGDGTPGYTDGTGTAARFMFPTSIAIDANDILYVTDTDAHTIRKITPAGVVTTLAGTGGLSGSTDATGAAARFQSPQGITVAANGNIYVADTGNHTIRKITPAALVSTLAGTAGVWGFLDATGTAAQFNLPTGISVGPDGNLAVADLGNHAIRKVTPAGAVVTWAGGPSNACAGTDGSWAVASLCNPGEVFVDRLGTTYFAEQNGHTIRAITPALEVSTIAGMITTTGSADGSIATASFTSLAGVIQRGSLIHVTDGNAIRTISLLVGAVVTSAGDVVTQGSSDGNGTAARFRRLSGLVADSSGNLFVCDTANHTIRKIDTSWNVTTFAGKASTPGAVDATGGNARFDQPVWIAIDAANNLYVTERGNYTVRKISPSAVVTTLAGTAGVSGLVDGTGTAARFIDPAGIACDSSGNLFVADSTAIRRVTAAGVVTTLAGSTAGGASDGTGPEAFFTDLKGIAIAPDGALVAADYSLIRRITTAGVVTTIGGVPQGTHGTEEGTSTVARFYYPQGIGIGPSGDLLIVHSARLVVGSPRIEDEATIDDTDGPLHVQRTLDSSPTTATSWKWSIVRRPAGSTAVLSDDTAPAPTFTPDVPDRFTFRLAATTMTGTGSITDVSLEPPCPVLSFGPSSLFPGLIGLPYAQTLLAANGTAPYRWEFQIGTLPPGITLTPTGQLVGTPTTTGLYEFDVVAEDSFGCRGDGSYQILVSNGPPNLVATGTPASVTVTWTNTGAALYKIFRKSAGTGFAQIATTISPTFSDFNVQANSAYAYYVKASVAMIDSAESNRDLATTHVFTDDPLVPGTIVKLVHLNQLRSAANSVRSLAGQSLLAITSETIIRKEPLTTLRQTINDARTALGIPTLIWTDITPGVTKVSTSHFTQLRNAVK